MDPSWLTGIGTLILAVATFTVVGISVWSVKKNNEANRQFREETERLRKKERECLGKLQALDIISKTKEIKSLAIKCFHSNQWAPSMPF